MSQSLFTPVSIEDPGSGRCLVTSENSFEIEGEAKPGLVATAPAFLVS